MGKSFAVVTLIAVVCSASSGVAGSGEFEQALSTVRSAKTDGSDSVQVRQAWQAIAASPASRLPDVLAAIDQATPLGANYLRTAVDSICERLVRNQRDVPRDQLEQFILDRSHDPRARHLAYQWLARFDATTPDRLLPRMADDPSVDLRRDAVARLIAEAKSVAQRGNKSSTVLAYRRALVSARDQDQVQEVAKQLRQLGETVDLQKHFGFITHWKLMAPFDNTDRKGFDVVYPPEKELLANAQYAGKNGSVKWIDFTTDHEFGMVDLNKPFGRLKEVVGYAWAEFESDREQEVELRLGCKNAWKLWLNGDLIFERNEYHRGMQMDQYRFPVKLQAGTNHILLKLCQNEQQETWTEQWEFQLRVCDATGTAILPSGE